MRYAGWREHEYAVDSRDDMPIDPNREPPVTKTASWNTPTVQTHPVVPQTPVAPKPQPVPATNTASWNEPTVQTPPVVPQTSVAPKPQPVPAPKPQPAPARSSAQHSPQERKPIAGHIKDPGADHLFDGFPKGMRVVLLIVLAAACIGLGIWAFLSK